MSDKPRQIQVSDAEAAALCLAGKYRAGVPMFWIRGDKTWADKAQMQAWRSQTISGAGTMDIQEIK